MRKPIVRIAYLINEGTSKICVCRSRGLAGAISDAETSQILMLRRASGDQAVIEKWSAPLTETERIDRNNAIFNHWLAGETSPEIANKCRLKERQVRDIIETAKQSKATSTAVSEQPPIYNVWNYGGCDPRFGQKHPGQGQGSKKY